MRWLADECIDAGVVSRLRSAGHDVVYMAELEAGTADREVLRQASEEGRLLLTEDKDFGELVFRSRQPASGVVLIRIAPEQRLLKWPRLQAAIEKFGAKLFGRYLVIEAARLRSRPLLQPLA
jgi:predicted nuclease of predicted toxin-antitoxin system